MGVVVTIPEDDGDEKYIFETAAEIGFESYYFMVNLGSLTFVFIFTMTIPLLLYYVLKPLISKSHYLRAKHEGISNGLQGNMFIRFIMEASLDVFLCLGLQFYYEDVNNGLNFDSAFEAINTILVFILGIVTFVFVPFALAFYISKFASWGDEDFDKKYGATLDGLRKDRYSSIAYYIIFILRRLLFAIVAILAPHNLAVQIFTLIFTCMVQIVYLIVWKPFEEPLMHRLEVFNEITSTLLCYVLFCFSPANLYYEDSLLEYDLTFVGFIAINVLVHLGLLSKNSFISVKGKIKAKCCK